MNQNKHVKRQEKKNFPTKKTLLTLISKRKLFEDQIPNGRKLTVRVHPYLTLLHHQPLPPEQRTVQRQRLVLAALAAHIAAVLGLQLQEQRPHLGQRLAQVLARLQAAAGHLDEDGVEARGDHGGEQVALVLVPQVGERVHGEARANVLHAVLLVC